MRKLIIFAKAPLKGKVKTRLLKDTPLDEDDILKLYSSFLVDTATLAGRSIADKLFIHYTPKENESDIKAIFKKAVTGKEIVYSPQKGNDFVSRSKTSLNEAMNKGTTIMIGSDSPTLQTKTINDAFKILEDKTDVVLGSSGEGGIYLIGLRDGLSFDYQKIFSDGAELSNFAGEVKKANLTLNLRHEVSDVDVAEDLVTLISLVEAIKVTSSTDGFPIETSKTLDTLNLKIERQGGTRKKVIIKNAD